MLKKPYFFCDVDGVINALPFERKFMPAKTIAYSENDLASLNQDVIDHRDFYNSRKHFKLDNEAKFTYWANTQYDLEIHWSKELITKLRELIASDQIEFVWLTMWNEHAVELLNPLFNFPDTIKNLHVERVYNDKYQSAKYESIKTLYSEFSKEEKRPFIWIDDVATAKFTTWPVLGENNDKDNPTSVKKELGVNSLILQTDSRFGIQKSEWKAIMSYLETGRVPRRENQKSNKASIEDNLSKSKKKGE